MPGRALDSHAFYGEYHGHLVEHLDVVKEALAQEEGKALIWLAGDSSLDNNYWFPTRRPAAGAYAHFLDPPESKADVAHWVTAQAEASGAPYCCINTAVEESTIEERNWSSGLLTQDEFLRDHIQEGDVLIVSVGGNDVALRQTCCTICNMATLVKCIPECCLRCACGCALPCDDPCGGCCCSCCSNCLAWPPGYGYFLHLYGTRVQGFINKLTAKTRPKKILVCMIYYPGVEQTGSWADTTLRLLGYDDNPEKLQLLISSVFRHATSRISVSGSQVVPVPLFEVLDGKRTEDYCARVEPSPSGGKKMANQFLSLLGDARAEGAPYGATSAASELAPPPGRK